MEEQFTMFWNHPKIVGITYWGYIVGKTWRNGTGLMSSSGTERPALTWLKDFVEKNPNPPNDFSNLLHLNTAVMPRSKPVASVSQSASGRNALRIGLTRYPNQRASEMYVSNNRAEKFSLGGKRMVKSSIGLSK